MNIPSLHRQPVALDPERHRRLKLNQPQMDWSVAAQLNALLVVGTEFGDVCREYPILFVPAGKDGAGRAVVAPVAAFGLQQQQNLYLEGGQWRALYMPALLRAYPFSLGRQGGDAAAVLCIDMAWPGLSQDEGLPLYGDDGTPGEHLRAMMRQFEQLETEIKRTHALCRLLQDKALLRDVRFDADLPDGSKLKVDGFLAVDEKKLAELGDADVIALQRNGVLGLIHAHQISMGNMRKLVQWHVERGAKPAPAGGAAPSAVPGASA